MSERDERSPEDVDVDEDNERWKPPAQRRGASPPAPPASNGISSTTESESAAPVSPATPPHSPFAPHAPTRDRFEPPAPSAPHAEPEIEIEVREQPEQEEETTFVWSERARQSAAAAETSPSPARAATAVLAPVVEIEGVAKDYPMGDGVVHALKPVSLKVPRGQLIAIHGRSGSGKTTLLNMIGGLDRPTAGRVWIDGAEVTAMPESELVELRRFKLGFIFQAFGLIPILTAAENVEVPLRLAKVDVAERDERVRVLLELVGLGERARHRPFELSGGEQQRVAIARALANSPRLLLADEPTGQLDSNTARSIMTLIRALVKSEGVTAIVATHDPILIDLADRVIELRDGIVLDDTWQRG